MTFEQFFQIAVGEYWLLTTLLFPQITFFYAFITHQTIWCMGSLVTYLIFHSTTTTTTSKGKTK